MCEVVVCWCAKELSMKRMPKLCGGSFHIFPSI
uniref:Uncharacterized protein n=1 Tax=Rhizophora mucronata TaxID=61149 RepID=A0A2P2MW13_RHIMU